MPCIRRSWMSLGMTTLGNAPFMSRKSAATTFPFRCSFLMKEIMVCMASVVVRFGRPP